MDLLLLIMRTTKTLIDDARGFLGKEEKVYLYLKAESLMIKKKSEKSHYMLYVKADFQLLS